MDATTRPLRQNCYLAKAQLGNNLSHKQANFRDISVLTTRFFIAALFLFSILMGSTNAQTLDLDALLTENKPVALGPYTEYWLDENRKATIQTAVARIKDAYKPLIDEGGSTTPIVLNHNSGVLWLKLRLPPLSTTSVQNWRILFKDHRIEKLTAYQMNRSGMVSKTVLGRTQDSRQPSATAAGLSLRLEASDQPSMLFIAIDNQIPAHIHPVAVQTERLHMQEAAHWLYAAFFPTALFMAWLCYIGLSRVRKRSIPGMLWTLGPLLASYCWINTPLSHNFRMLGSGWTWQIALTTTPLLVSLAFFSLVKHSIEKTAETSREDQILAYTPVVFLLAIVANLALAPANSLWLGWTLLGGITIWSIILLHTRATQKSSAKLFILAMVCWLPLCLLEIGLAAGIAWTHWPKTLLQGPLILLSEILIFVKIEWMSLQQDERNSKRLYQQKRSISQTLKNLEISLEVKNRFFQKISRDLGLQIRALSALDQHKDLPDYCHKGLEQLRSLARDIQRFCEIEAGCLQLTHRPFDFKALIKSLTFAHTRLAQHKGLTFTSSQCSAVPDTLIGDPEVIAQLLSQLLDNAIRYTSSGKIDLKFQISDPKGKNTNENETMIMVTIADTGPGLPEHLQKQFYGITESEQKTESAQHSNQTVHHSDQLGVGLTTCRHMVELMQGEIHITSLHDTGTTCYINIPLRADTNRNSQVAHKRKARPQTIKTSSVLGKAGVKVALVITEDESLQTEIPQWLGSIGYKARCATNTESTLDLATQNAVDLFIYIDANNINTNNQANGIETISQIRQMSTYKKTPIIVACKKDAATEQQYREVGVTTLLVHPLTEESLLKLLAAWEAPPVADAKDATGT